jgi:Plasmid pRiA4b ORF-3-like protein
MPQVYSLRITLLETEPSIWRTINVSSEMLLVDIHRIVQTTMGWSNSHMHQFSDLRSQYAPKEFGLTGSKDSRKTKLDLILKSEGDAVLYEYDFGDGWTHEIVLESVSNYNAKMELPCCTGGARHCPPEDCGGVWGYADLLAVISDKTHEDYEEMREWIGNKFDAEHFDKKKINRELKKKDYGCIWL